MVLRIECNVMTGEVVEIEQSIYINEDQVVMVLDADDPSPHGFEEFTGDPSELPDTEASTES